MLYGREEVEQVLSQLLAQVPNSQGGGLLVRGERGSGKSAVLDQAQSMASEFLVLRAAGAEGFDELPYGALAQLLRPLSDEIGTPSNVQYGGLKRVLTAAKSYGGPTMPLRSFDGGGERDRFVVPMAALNLLSESSQKMPTLLLIDDAQWVDRETAAVIAFIARRLDTENIAMVVTAGMAEDHGFSVPGMHQLDLFPLADTAIARLLEDVAGERPPSHVVEEVRVATLGNPRAIVMLASSLAADQLAGREPMPAPLPLSPSFESHLLARLRELPKATQTLLLIAALDESGDAARFFGAAERLGISVASALEPAESAGLIAVAGDAVSFKRPLLREAVGRAASFRDRQAAHRAIAGTLDERRDQVSHLWHIALATLGTDEKLATDLEEVSELARRTRGCAFAANILRRAAELSEDTERRSFRSMLEAEVSWMAGQVRRSLDLTAQVVLDPSASSEARVRARWARGWVQLSTGAMTAGIETLLSTANDAETPVDPMYLLAAQLMAAGAAFEIGDVGRAGRIARRVASLPPGTEEWVPFHFGMVPGTAPFVAADADARAPALGEALATAVDRDDLHWLVVASRICTWLGDEVGTYRYAERALGTAREQGAFGLMPELLMGVASANRAVESTARIEADAAEALRLAEELGLELIVVRALTLLTWATGSQGRADLCKEYAERGLQLSARLGASYYATAIKRHLATLASGLGDHGEAYRLLAEIQRPESGAHQAWALWTTPMYVDAAMRTKEPSGTLDRTVAAYEDWAAHGCSSWGMAMRANVHGLLAEDDSAIDAFEEAMRWHGNERTGFSRAQTQLAYGETLRRLRRPTDARVQLRSALGRFEMLGAAPWASRARAELRASGETPQAVSAGDEGLEMLTPQELQITRLVAAGLTNREVAARMFLSHRTVEYHLRKMFAKLNVSARSELMRLAMETIELDQVTVDNDVPGAPSTQSPS